MWFSMISLSLDDPSEAQKDEFLFEIATMKLLGAHQNILSLVGCCTLQDHKFLVIEYVPFGDLLHWLRSKRRTVGSYSITFVTVSLSTLTLSHEDGNATYSSSLAPDLCMPRKNATDSEIDECKVLKINQVGGGGGEGWGWTIKYRLCWRVPPNKRP